MFEFLKFGAAAIACMFAGSHLVYLYYQPMAVNIPNLYLLINN